MPELQNIITDESTSPRISKTIHIVWVGDESKCPQECVDSWRRLNPSWQVRLWGNTEYEKIEWINQHHMIEMWPLELNGVADLMRWEILYRHGGFAVDADSECVRPLPDWLTECEGFTAAESELIYPGRLATGYVGCLAENKFVKQLIDEIATEKTVAHKRAWRWKKWRWVYRQQDAWQTVGTMRLTNGYYRYRPRNWTILPSHFFIPLHHPEIRHGEKGYTGNFIYAHQHWGSTRKIYGKLK